MSNDGSNSNRSGNGAQSGIDLGLSSLLAVGDSSAVPHAPPSSSSSSGVRSSSGQEAKSELEALALQSNWEELLRICELQLSYAASTEARAWWVYAHLQRKSMPAAFLAAPFENLLLGNIADDTPAIRETLAKVASLLLLRLTDAGEHGLAKVVRERLEVLHIEVNTFDRTTAVPAKRNREDSSSNHSTPDEDRLADSNEASALAEFTGLTHLVSKAKVGERKEGTWRAAAAPKTGSKRWFTPTKSSITLVLLILVVGGGWFFKDKLRLLTSTQVSTASESFMSSGPTVELLSPDLQRRDMVGTLAALFYSIDATPTSAVESNGQAVPASETAVVGSATIPKIATKTPHDASGSNLTKLPSTVPTGKDVVRTDGPIEPAEVRERLQGRGQLPTAANKDSGDGRRRPADLPPSPSQAPRGDRDKNGIVMGIPEKSPDSGTRYQVIARTLVLLEPYYSSTVVGRLLPGDVVVVEGRVGDWLKLRSAKGRPGYVLAQDVAGAPYEEYRR